MEFFGEILGDAFGEVFVRIIFLLLKALWICLLWLFNLGQISYMSIWERPIKGWRGGLVFALIAIVFLLFLIFKSNS
ncbi:MAG: hypothetical protein V4506_07165 [Bacteroidota bacterium]